MEMDETFPNNPTNTMKKLIWITVLALPVMFTACKPKETTTEKVSSGAEKVAEGVKEMTNAAADEAAKDKGLSKAKAAELADELFDGGPSHGIAHIGTAAYRAT